MNTLVAQAQLARNYPPELRESGIIGTVTLELTLDRMGRVENATVVQATDRRFGDAAVRVANSMRFRPAYVRGTPVRCRFTIPVTFDLRPR